MMGCFLGHFFCQQKGPKTTKSCQKPRPIPSIGFMVSGQIIATSHDLTPKGSVLEGKWDPLFQGNRSVGELLFHLARWFPPPASLGTSFLAEKQPRREEAENQLGGGAVLSDELS